MTPITVALTPEYNDIWKNCHDLGNEMIVTTKIRRIFPTMEFQISGLEPIKTYKLSMHLERADNKKYRFFNSTLSYSSCNSPEPMKPPKIVFHPRGPQTGAEWMSNSISFDNIRITCTKQVEQESELFIYLHSGHRYQPVLVIYEEDKPVYVSKIEHMVFIVTTLYHKDGIRTYKRSINKFSSKSDGADKVGLTGTRKRSSAPATLESAKRSQDDGPSTSGAASVRSLSIVSLFGGASPESQEEVGTPLLATPKSRRRALPKTEAPESRCTTPEPQIIKELPAPGAPQRLARRQGARSFSPTSENIEGPRAPSRPERPAEPLPFRVLNPGYSMESMMNMMMMVGMMPYPIPMMLPAQPLEEVSDENMEVDIINHREPEETDETEEEDVDIVN
ncbi:hypothetical protein CAEBREN_15660 [Caenorhabditis brenneri]|uniref:T-box domain-containing protein n=1 Tax=Caenorhabditis brenneri TaxID=135651 RepID=G0MLJ7_CAEBE|nr:hypothetical protein CAEBREN_15660 [Caenorhabditis brenneri]